MKRYLDLLLLVFLIACSDTKPKSNLVVSVSNRQEQIKSEIEIKKERIKLVEIGNKSPIGSLIDQDSTIRTTNDYIGKLLIIDFWATWCSPCLKEMPKFKELEREYENEKVEFITISLDDQFSYWREFIIENNWGTDNYWFGMNEAVPFFSYMYSEIEIENQNTILIGLPKYVIIGPSGKIINNRASKPSDPQFETELLNLIEIQFP